MLSKLQCFRWLLLSREVLHGEDSLLSGFCQIVIDCLVDKRQTPPDRQQPQFGAMLTGLRSGPLRVISILMPFKLLE